MKRSFVALHTLAFLCAACSPETGTITSQEIVSSVEVGEKVEQAAPYGLPLYPGAKVSLRMLQGTGMQIEVEATTDQIADFYATQFKKEEYQIEDINKEDDAISFSALKKQERMRFKVQPSKNSDNSFILIIVKILNE